MRFVLSMVSGDIPVVFLSCLLLRYGFPYRLLSLFLSAVALSLRVLVLLSALFSQTSYFFFPFGLSRFLIRGFLSSPVVAPCSVFVGGGGGGGGLFVLSLFVASFEFSS